MRVSSTTTFFAFTTLVLFVLRFTQQPCSPPPPPIKCPPSLYNHHHADAAPSGGKITPPPSLKDETESDNELPIESTSKLVTVATMVEDEVTRKSQEEEEGKSQIETSSNIIHPSGVVDGECPGGYRLSHLLSRFIDIDFIEFVLSSQPSPKTTHIIDIGIYQAGELIHMASQGFHIKAFEPNPNRFKACMEEISKQSEAVQKRIDLKNLAVSDDERPIHFQLAGLDSHAYVLEDGEAAKEKSVMVQTIPINKVVDQDVYFIKIDTQGFDTRILDSLLSSIQSKNWSIPFIQFEFSPYFEVNRSRRSKESHKVVLRRLIDAGYDVYQGAALQPWIKSHRGTYGKSPLSMIAPDKNMPTCVDEFVEKMHAGKNRPILPGKTSNSFGTWMDILAVKRLRYSPYYRHTGWVLAKRM